MTPIKTSVLLLITGGLLGCASLEVKPVAFRSPDQYPVHFRDGGLVLAFVPIVDSESSIESFNVDFSSSQVLPVRIIVENRGAQEVVVEAEQVFGVTGSGDFYTSYTLDQSTRIIRRSEIGNGMATGAAVGLLAGAAIGASIGAAVGGAVDGSHGAGIGASAGAVGGGTSGLVGGAARGADGTERRIRLEIRRADWGSQVVYPGMMKMGYVFLPREKFAEIAFNLYDLTSRQPVSGALPFVENNL